MYMYIYGFQRCGGPIFVTTRDAISPLSGPGSAIDKISNECLIFLLQRGRPVGKQMIPAIGERK
jgi:hypothetical protein